MRTISMIIATASMLALGLVAQAQEGQTKAKAAPQPPKNLKILKPEEVRPMMGAFVASLGLADKGGCVYCHVMGDFAADTNPKKDIARAMITMAKEINAKFPDGNEHVSCFTCHRGDPHPALAPAAK